MTALSHTFSDPDALLNEIQAAIALGFSPRTLQKWRQKGTGPKVVKVSAKAVRYRKCDLAAWAESKLI
jgi:predicted DNA-binding transcriptional regulator AlpA